MNVRRLAAVAVALSCAFATPSSAAGSVSMDGVRRVKASYKGKVTAPALPLTTERTIFEPSPEDCGAPGSCDVTAIRLTLPKGTTAGKFKATLTVPLELNATAVLFDSAGRRVGQPASMFYSGQYLCCERPSWRMSLVVPRLAAGQYTLVVFDQGGSGEFTADLDYTANRPDRQRGKN